MRRSRRLWASMTMMQRGFTLIELMIVVVIIGILASLGIYSVTNYIQSAKVSEAREIVAAIMAGQAGYHAETGKYLDVSGGLGDDNLYPSSDIDGRVKIQWGAVTSCTGGNGQSCARNFQVLGVTVDNPVSFRYATRTYATDAGPTFGGRADVCKGAMGSKDGYEVVAVSDLDGDGGKSTVVVGSAAQADLCTANPGE